jgi:putative heme-binding domain-containing protein
LADERHIVRKRAVEVLKKEGKEALAELATVLKKSEDIQGRRNAVWVLTQIGSTEARKSVRLALNDKDEGVQSAALHSISLWRDVGSEKQLAKVISGTNAVLQRVAAEAVGRIGDKRAVSGLLGALNEKTDRILEHSLTYALIEIADPSATASGLNAENVSERRAALVALDQMEKGGLKAETVASLIGSRNLALRSTASWVALHHPDWGDALGEFFWHRVLTPLTDTEREELSEQLAQFARSESIQNVIGMSLREPIFPSANRIGVLRAISMANLTEPPKIWNAGVKICLESDDKQIVRDAVATARTLSQTKTNAPSFSEDLLRIAKNENHPTDLRLEALAALPNGLRPVEPGMFAFLCANVDSSKPVMMRSAAVSVLTKSKLNEDQLLALIDTIKNAGPLEMAKLLTAFERSKSEAVGLKLVAALKEAKGLSSLRVDVLQSLLAKYPATVQEHGKELLVLLNADAAKQSAHIDELLKLLKDGDLRRGQAIFNSQKAACFSCHTVGYLGGKVGPDLTSIGQARTERDLLESVIYPSASFVRSYEPYIITTKSDETYSGVLKKDAADEVVLATGPGADVRIARADITEMRPGTVSVMPAGLEQQMTKQELADLLAFLKSTKWGPR